MFAAADWSPAHLLGCGHNGFGSLLLLRPGRVRFRRGDERTVEDLTAGKATAVTIAGGVATFMAAPNPGLRAVASCFDNTKDPRILHKVSLNNAMQA